jgi:hypothetical protein
MRPWWLRASLLLLAACGSNVGPAGEPSEESGGAAGSGRGGSGGKRDAGADLGASGGAVVVADAAVDAVGNGAVDVGADLAADSAASPPDAATNVLPILLVIANDPNPSPTTGMMAALSGAGLRFEVQNSSTTPLTPASAMGKALVIINPNTPRGNVPAAFKDVPVPVMVSKDGPSNTLMMVTGEASTAPTLHAITIIAPGDPLAAGFPMGNVTVYGPANRLIFGNPGPEAKKVATVAGSPNEIAIYYFAAGATMAGGFKAPAKRIGFFWHRTSDVTADGRKLFLAAVKWAIAR